MSMNNRRKFLSCTAKALSLLTISHWSSHAVTHSLVSHKEEKRLFNRLGMVSRQLLAGNISTKDWMRQIDACMRANPNLRSAEQIIEKLSAGPIINPDTFDFGSKGRSSVSIDAGIDFLSTGQEIKTKIVGLKPGHSIPPHVHESMSSTTIVLSGNVQLKQYDWIQQKPSNTAAGDPAPLILKPLQNVLQKPGDWSTMTTEHSNLHWFIAQQEPVFLLNINVEGIAGKARPGIRVRVDEKPNEHHQAKGFFITDEEAEKYYNPLAG